MRGGQNSFEFTYSGDVGVGKVVLRVSKQQWRLPHPRVSDQQHLYCLKFKENNEEVTLREIPIPPLPTPPPSVWDKSHQIPENHCLVCDLSQYNRSMTTPWRDSQTAAPVTSSNQLKDIFCAFNPEKQDADAEYIFEQPHVFNETQDSGFEKYLSKGPPVANWPQKFLWSIIREFLVTEKKVGLGSQNFHCVHWFCFKMF